jgi:hypothetical protein
MSFWDRVAFLGAGESDCWPFDGAKSVAGYGTFRRPLTRKMVPAHRFAFELTHGRVPVGMVLHSCDNPPCCNPGHLREGSAADNALDREIRGRVNWKKLTPQIVKTIRELHRAGVAPKWIAGFFGIYRAHVRAIIDRKIWRYVCHG